MLISLDHIHEQNIEVGEFLNVVVVKTANIFKDLKGNWEDMKGGHMKVYEELIQDTVDTALKQLEQKAKARGYDGVIGVKIAHPTVANGGAEVIVYGNGFRKITKS
ncbi:hypothetical protein BV378_36350 [Nostoc sp. RF31YmG]|nr:hypothetical protein BV378_36350 [Nostoc sp. RF31YmG]